MDPDKTWKDVMQQQIALENAKSSENREHFRSMGKAFYDCTQPEEWAIWAKTHGEALLRMSMLLLDCLDQMQSQRNVMWTELELMNDLLYKDFEGDL